MAKKKAQTDEEARLDTIEILRTFTPPSKQKANDSVTEPLLKRYGLGELAQWCITNGGPSFYDMPPVEIERFCIRAKMAGWKWALNEEMTLPANNPFPVPSVAYPLFDYGNNGPVGHFRNLADIVWQGKIEWTKHRGQTNVHNHFLSRCLWDLTNRTQYCDDGVLYNMMCGPGSCGKTFAASLRLLLLFYAFPRHFMGKVCSSSKGAAESRVWAEVIEWHEASIFHEVSVWGGTFKQWAGGSQRLLFVEEGSGKTKGADGKKDARRGIELVALPRSAIGKGAVRQLKGMRQDVKLWVVDEATDVDPSAFDAEIAGNWLEAPILSQIVYLANPTHDSSAFVEHYMAKDGEWYDADSPGWLTKHFGYVTNLNGLDTPNRDWRSINDNKRSPREHSCPFPYITNLSGIERLEIRAGGRNTAAFMSQAVGFLPSADIADSILTLPMLQACGAMGTAEWTGDGVYPLGGNDPAFGGDDFVVAPGEIGLAYVNINGVREKRVMLNIQPLLKVPYLINNAGASTPEEAQAQWVLDRFKITGISHLSAVASDNTGTSRAFVTVFESMAKAQGWQGSSLHRVGWKERCSERIEAPDDPTARKSIDAYTDSTSELVMAVRQWRRYLRGFTDEDLIDQFGKRKFHVAAQNRYKVQTKDEFSKGVAARGWAPYGFSPDEMDAVCVLVDLARQCGLGTSTLKHPSMIDGGGRLFARRKAGARLYGGSANQADGWLKIKAS